jgi:hypothetical protein
MKIHDAKQGDLKDKLFKWLCHAQVDNIPVE